MMQFGRSHPTSTSKFHKQLISNEFLWTSRRIGTALGVPQLFRADFMVGTDFAGAIAPTALKDRHAHGIPTFTMVAQEPSPQVISASAQQALT